MVVSTQNINNNTKRHWIYRSRGPKHCRSSPVNIIPVNTSPLHVSESGHAFQPEGTGMCRVNPRGNSWGHDLQPWTCKSLIHDYHRGSKAPIRCKFNERDISYAYQKKIRGRRIIRDTTGRPVPNAPIINCSLMHIKGFVPIVSTIEPIRTNCQGHGCMQSCLFVRIFFCLCR